MAILRLTEEDFQYLTRTRVRLQLLLGDDHYEPVLSQGPVPFRQHRYQSAVALPLGISRCHQNPLATMVKARMVVQALEDQVQHALPVPGPCMVEAPAGKDVDHRGPSLVPWEKHGTTLVEVCGVLPPKHLLLPSKPYACYYHNV
jgi:hypothetical protein